MGIKSTNTIDAMIGARIRARRLIAQMSQSDLGKALGLTFQQIQKYELGVNRVGAARLYEIAQIFAVPVSHFYEGLDESESLEAPSRDSVDINVALMRIADPDQRSFATRLAVVVLDQFRTDSSRKGRG